MEAVIESPPMKLKPSCSVYATRGLRYDNPPKATIDFETRSACSIKDCGSWRYSQIGRASCRERV